MESHLLPRGPIFMAGAFAFLGPESPEEGNLLECLLLLLSHKTICPHRVCLIRGNNDSNTVGILEREVKKRFSEAADRILQKLIVILNLFPVAAIVEDGVLISRRPPVSAVSLDEIKRIGTSLATEQENLIEADILLNGLHREDDVADMKKRLQVGVVVSSNPERDDGVGVSGSDDSSILQLHAKAMSALFVDRDVKGGIVRPMQFK